MAFYKARFADAGNFTFVFVGSFTPETLRPLVETYLASLPATRAHETWRDLGITPPTGMVEKTVRKGIAPKSAVAIVFSGPFQYDDEHILALRTMTLVLQSRLLDMIRQELGGTYSITVTPSVEKLRRRPTRCGSTGRAIPRGRRRSSQRVFQEIEFVKTTPFRPEGMAGLRQTAACGSSTTGGRTTGTCSDRSRAVTRTAEAGTSRAIDRAADRIAALSADAIQRAAVAVSRHVAVREGDADARGQVAARHAKDAHLVDEDERVTRSIGRSSRSPHSFQEPV